MNWWPQQQVHAHNQNRAKNRTREGPGTGHLLRGGRGYKTEGETCEVLPLPKVVGGGAEKVLMLMGGHKSFGVVFTW